MTVIESIKNQLNESIALKQALLNNDATLAEIKKTIEIINQTLKTGKKLLIAGNGGSASQSQHMAAELINKFRLARKALPAIALTTDTSNITAISNDSGFDFVFSRQIEALGVKGDILIILTTSDVEPKRGGHSANLYQAIRQAKKLNITTIGLISLKTRKLLKMLDLAIIAPATATPRVQEIHGLIIHLICGEVERLFIE